MGIDFDGIFNVVFCDLVKDLGEVMVLMVDICLDEFIDYGYCGVFDDWGWVDNDVIVVCYVELVVV